MNWNNRWATPQQIRREFEFWNGTAGGVPVATETGRLLIQAHEGHSLVIGSSGCGKTRRILMPQIRMLLEAKESLIVIDPKGELYRVLGGLVPPEANFHFVNFADITASERVNILGIAADLWGRGDPASKQKASEIIEGIAYALYPEDNAHADPFWKDSARSVFVGACLTLCEIDPKELNFTSVFNLINEGGEMTFQAGSRCSKLQRVLGTIDPNSAAHALLASYMNTAEDTRGGIRAEMNEGLQLVRSDASREFGTGDDLRLAELDGSMQNIFWVVLPDQTPVYNAFAGLLCQSICNVFLTLADEKYDGVLPRRLNVIIDELASTAASLRNTLPAMFASSRSRNVRITACLQSKHQLEDLFGSSVAKSIADCISTYIVFRHYDLSSLEEFSKMSGETVEQCGSALVTTRVLSATDLMSLRTGECLVLGNGRTRFVSQLPDYSEVFDESGPYQFPVRKRSKNCEGNVFHIDEYFLKRERPAQVSWRDDDEDEEEEDVPEEEKDAARWEDERTYDSKKDVVLTVLSVPGGEVFGLSRTLSNLFDESLGATFNKLMDLPSIFFPDSPQTAALACKAIHQHGGTYSVLQLGIQS